MRESNVIPTPADRLDVPGGVPVSLESDPDTIHFDPGLRRRVGATPRFEHCDGDISMAGRLTRFVSRLFTGAGQRRAPAT